MDILDSTVRQEFLALRSRCLTNELASSVIHKTEDILKDKFAYGLKSRIDTEESLSFARVVSEAWHRSDVAVLDVRSKVAPLAIIQFKHMHSYDVLKSAASAASGKYEYRRRTREDFRLKSQRWASDQTLIYAVLSATNSFTPSTGKMGNFESSYLRNFDSTGLGQTLEGECT